MAVYYFSLVFHSGSSVVLKAWAVSTEALPGTRQSSLARCWVADVISFGVASKMYRLLSK